jgi:hypothetical protein
MAFFTYISEQLKAFILDQKLFFTATAPARGRINLSPKGMDTFRCLDRRTVAYLDLTGSGNETSAHLEENGRMTVMFCSFSEKPLILRLYGAGRVVRPRDAGWHRLIALFAELPGQRQIIVLEIDSVQTSCGFAVPMYTLKGERETLKNWAKRKGSRGVEKYWRDHNQVSIDGLPTSLFQQDR